jgi:organic radical activating enzyme
VDRPVQYAKFEHPDITAKGETRAQVPLSRLETLWFNTGSLCNLSCQGCYMESSPTNDRLAYITLEDVRSYLDEIAQLGWSVREIGFTGGEPFMNPQIIDILRLCLERDFDVLVLSNAMKPLQHHKKDLKGLHRLFKEKLSLRISVDHYNRSEHEKLRGENSWEAMTDGLHWLSENKFRLAVAGRTLWNETQEKARSGYAAMFERYAIDVKASDPGQLVLFPEMDIQIDVPEITVGCWDILGVRPDAMMCATSRMVVKRKKQGQLKVVPCTLLPYDPKFDMGSSLKDADKGVALNHPHCAKFCVLGGGSCSKN